MLIFILFNLSISILFNPYIFVQFNPEKYLFHLGDWVKPSDQKDMDLGTIAFHVQRSSAITRNTCSAKRQ